MEAKKPLWIGVGLGMLTMALGGLRSVVPLSPAGGTDSLRKVMDHFITASLIASLWAICFRPELEKWRFGLFSLFVLITMQAVGLGVVQFLWSLWQ